MKHLSRKRKQWNKKKLEIVDISNNKVYSEDFLNMLIDLSGPRTKVLVYILKNINRNRKLYKTINQVSKEANVNYMTAHSIFKYLQEKKIIKKLYKAWIISPNFLKKIEYVKE